MDEADETTEQARSVRSRRRLIAIGVLVAAAAAATAAAVTLIVVDNGERRVPVADPPASSTTATSTTSTSVAASPTTASPTATVAEPRLSGDSRLRFDGIGPVALGMTEGESRQAAGVPLRSSSFGACRALRVNGEPSGLTLIMSEGQRINVITVSGTTSTDRGIRIGSAQANVLAAYGGAEVRNPDEPRHWVFARSAGYTMIFEIENGAVVAFRTGVRDVVEQDEICA